MTHESGAHRPDVSPSGEYRVDQCSTEFENSWKSGKRERIEEWLPRVPPLDQPRLLYELILVEVELRRTAGESPHADEYRQCFRDQSEIVHAAFVELSKRSQVGSVPAPEGAVGGNDINGVPVTSGDPTVCIGTPPGAIAKSSTSNTLTPSALLGDFLLLREIGRGGMGVVYEALQVSLGRHVALKTLPYLSALDSRRVQRFKIEAQAAAMLDHPNIVRVHAFGVERGVHYYAMQLVNGTDLKKVIEALRGASSESRRNTASTSHNGVVPTQESSTAILDACTLFGMSASNAVLPNDRYFKTFARLGTQAAEALHASHLSGIVHRDIKPANLLLDVEGNIRVTDFGLAQIHGEVGVDATGELVGTLRYMSPEQVYAKRIVVDNRTDIYSLGVTLYELLTLQPAFDGANRAELLRKIAFEDPPSPRRLNRRIPIDLETIVIKAMSKSPDQRYQTAAELADDLSRFSNSEPIRAKPPTYFDFFKKWCSRHKPLVGSLAIMLFIAVVATMVSSGVVWRAWRLTEAALQSEQDQHKKAVELLRKAEGLRLAALSALERPKDPGLAFAMAVEGYKLYPHRELRSALLAAFESAHEHRTLLGHDGPVGSVSFSRHGDKLITTAGRTEFDHSPDPARIWNVATGELLVSLNSQLGNLTSAVFSPTGHRILATSTPISTLDGQVDGTDPRHHPTIWDSQNGDKLLTLTDSYLLDAHVSAFDAVGQRVVVPALGNSAKIWDVIDGTVLVTLSGHTQRVIFAAFDVRGEQVATVSEDLTVRIWSSRDGMLLSQLAHWKQPGSEPFRALFSPDGKRLATVSKKDGIQIWNTGAGANLNAEPWPGETPHFLPDGERMVYTRYFHTQIRRVSDGQLVREFPGQLATVNGDGSLVATKSGENVLIWNTNTGARLAELLGHGRHIVTAEFDPASRFLATASYDGTARLWHVTSGSERLTFDAPVLMQHPVLATSDDSRHVAVATTPLVRTQLIDLDADKVVFDVIGRTRNPDLRGSRLLTYEGNRAQLIDVATETKIAEFEESKEKILSAQLSHDGAHALIVADHGPSWLWHIESNERVRLVGHEAQVLELDWSPNGEFAVTGSEDGTVRVWNAKSGLPMHLFRHPHPVWHVRVHPDCNRLAVVMSNDEGALWDLRSGAQIARFLPEDGIRFRQVEFSPLGDRLYGFQEEESLGVLCWNTEDGELEGSYSPVRGRVRISTSATGDRIVIASSEDGAMVWGPPGEPTKLTDTATAFGTFLSEDQVVLATLGLNHNPEALTMAERRKYATAVLQVRDATEGTLVRTFASPVGRTSFLSVVPNGRQLLISSAFYGIAIFDSESHEVVSAPRGHGAPVSFLGFASDAIVSTSWDGTAAVWKVASGVQSNRLNLGHPISTAALSRDATRLAVGDVVGDVSVWAFNEAEMPVNLQAHRDLVKVVAFRSDEHDRLITTSLDKSMLIHESEAGATRTVDIGDTVFQRSQFSNDGSKWLLVPTNTRMFAGWMAEGGNFHAVFPDWKTVHEVSLYTDEGVLLCFDAKSNPIDAAFRADGREIVTIGAQHIIIWDVTLQHPIREIDVAGDVLDGMVSRDGRLAVTEQRDIVSLWNLDSGAEIMTVTPINKSDTFRATHFDPTTEQIFTIVNQRLKAYPTHVESFVDNSPRRLTRQERHVYDILDENEWIQE